MKRRERFETKFVSEKKKNKSRKRFKRRICLRHCNITALVRADLWNDNSWCSFVQIGAAFKCWILYLLRRSSCSWWSFMICSLISLALRMLRRLSAVSRSLDPGIPGRPKFRSDLQPKANRAGWACQCKLHATFCVNCGIKYERNWKLKSKLHRHFPLRPRFKVWNEATAVHKGFSLQTGLGGRCLTWNIGGRNGPSCWSDEN